MNPNNPDQLQRITAYNRFNVSWSYDFKNKYCKSSQPTYSKRVTTLRGLLDVISSGNAWSPAQWQGERNTANFTASELIAIDIDGYSLEYCLTHDFVNQYACMGYTTASGKGCRLVFALDNTITNGKEYSDLIKAVLHILTDLEPDKACKDPCRQYYGSTLAINQGQYLNEHAPILPIAFLQSFNVIAMAATPTPADTLQRDRAGVSVQKPAQASHTPINSFADLRKEITRALKSSGRDLIHYDYIACPMHNHEHDYEDPKAQWTEDNGLLYCFKCERSYNTIEVATALGLDIPRHAPTIAERDTIHYEGVTVEYDPNTLAIAQRLKESHLYQLFEVLTACNISTVQSAIKALERVGIVRHYRTFLDYFKAGHGKYWEYNGYTGSLSLYSQAVVNEDIYQRAMSSEDLHTFDNGHTIKVAELTKHNRPGTTNRIKAPIATDFDKLLTVAIAVFMSAYNSPKISQSKLRAIFGIGSNSTLQAHLNNAIASGWIVKQSARLQSPVIARDRIVTRSANIYTGRLERVGCKYEPVNIDHIDRYYFDSEHSALLARRHASYGYEYLVASDDPDTRLYNRSLPKIHVNCTDDFSKALSLFEPIPELTSLDLLHEFQAFSDYYQNRNKSQPNDTIDQLETIKHKAVNIDPTRSNVIATTPADTLQPEAVTIANRPDKLERASMTQSLVSITITGDIAYTLDNGQSWQLITQSDLYSYDQLKALCKDLTPENCRLSQSLARAQRHKLQRDRAANEPDNKTERIKAQ